MGKTKLAGMLAVLIVLGALGAAVAMSQRLPEGPVEVSWDLEACRHCHMHVGEPAFAAQLQTRDGQVLNFDDPGCLLLHVDEHRPAIHAIWFHHVREDRWVAASKTAFVPASPSPMGHGLGAVDAGAAGALTYAEALDRVKAGVAAGVTR